MGHGMVLQKVENVLLIQIAAHQLTVAHGIHAQQGLRHAQCIGDGLHRRARAQQIQRLGLQRFRQVSPDLLFCLLLADSA